MESKEEKNFDPLDIAQKFDHFLKERKLKFSGVVIGGSALFLLEIINRSTRDFDLLEREIPKEISAAAKSFALENGLSEHWLNSDPVEFIKYLPSNWRSEIELIFEGEALQLWTIARIELLKAKVWAYCDRSKDYDDILAMRPNAIDLENVKDWLYPLDTNPSWPKWVDICVDKIKEGLKNA